MGGGTLRNRQQKKDMNTQRYNPLSKMMILYLLLLFGGGIGIVYGIVKIQWIDGDMWREKGERRVKDIREEPAKRGDIVSSDGKILATTLPECDLYLDLARELVRDEKGNIVKDKKGNPKYTGAILDSNFEKGVKHVSQLLHRANPGKTAKDYEEALRRERSKRHASQCYLVARNIDYATWSHINETEGWGNGVVKTLVDRDGKKYSVTKMKRAHIYGNIAANVIGIRNGERGDSYTGLEGYYDSILRGQAGRYSFRRLTRGLWVKDGGSGYRTEREGESIVTEESMLQERRDGEDIVATIDTRYQDVAESALRESLKRYGGQSGCAILMEVKTGYVLACSNLTIDTVRDDYNEQKDHNIACGDVYEPGSTFKTVVMAAMMSDEKVPFDTAERVGVRAEKRYSANGCVITDGHIRTDTISVKEVLAKSSNTGMCELGWKYYRKRRQELVKQMRAVFPYEILRLDLRTDEPRSSINDLRSDCDFLHYTFGYATQVSAMQVLTFYNALANGGKMVKPLFCKAIGREGRYREIEPVVLREEILPEEGVKVMTEMLENVVERGTGKKAKSSYRIAGKTGTAQWSYGGTRWYNASFAGYFPADDPKYSCLVVVKRVGVNGGDAAAPVFKKIADCVMGMDRSISKSGWPALTDTASYHAPAAKKTTEVKSGTVPDVRGMSIRSAIKTLRSIGLRVRFEGCGKVTRQSPKAGTRVKKGAVVTVALD